MPAKDFNLELALSGKKVITINGRPVQIVFVSKSDSSYPVLAIINPNVVNATSYQENQKEEWYTLDGKYDRTLEEHGLDLVMAPKTKKLWIRILLDSEYAALDGSMHKTSNAYSSKELLIQNQEGSQIVEVEIEI